MFSKSIIDIFEIHNTCKHSTKYTFEMTLLAIQLNKKMVYMLFRNMTKKLQTP